MEAAASAAGGAGDERPSMKRAQSSLELELEAGNACKKGKVPDLPGFHNGFSLQALRIPKEAWPQKGKNKGKFGYTITAANGAVPLLGSCKWSDHVNFDLDFIYVDSDILRRLRCC